jgi:pimeloyl-ACP methyl ester carboxylesterase
VKIFSGDLMVFVVMAVGIYFIIAIAAYLFQEKLIYIPGSTGCDSAQRYGLEPWPNRDDFHGYITKNQITKIKGTILIWHGNAGTALDRTYYVNALERRGFRVILMEFPGYGDRAGDLSEQAFVEDAMSATEKAFHQFNGPFIIWGESMGCGVASKVAVYYQSKIAGLVMVTPWANLPDLAQAKYPILPAKFLVKDSYDNIKNLVEYKGKTAIAMAEFDEVIPPKHTQKLYESIQSTKQEWLFSGAGHNSWPVNESETWWDEVLYFINQK